MASKIPTASRCLAATMAMAAAITANAEQRTATISEVVVKGQLLDSRRSAYSSTTFSAAQVEELNISHTQALFDQVPGMSIRKLGLAGVADNIVIRGFGGGGHGGDLGAVIDGIPLNEAMSHADGYVDFNVVVPLEVESLTVYKGPVSALYGNYNRGGLVRVDTRKGGEYTALDMATGSDGLLDLQAAWGGSAGENQHLNLAAQHYRSDGYRPQADSEHSTLAGRWSLQLGQLTDLALSARWHDADSDSPSYLTLEQYRRQPYGIDPRASNDGADKRFATLRADLNHDLGDQLRLLSFAYSTRQDFSRWFSRPVGDGLWRQREESYDREVSGAGSNLNGLSQLGAVPVTWVAGIEGFRERTDFAYYDGLDNRQRRSPAIDDRRTRLNSVAGFLEAQAELHPLFMPSVGARYDRFSGRCQLRGPETGNNPCNRLNSLDNLSPKLGFRSQIHDSLQLRVSWAEGFALPNGWVKYQAEATNLDPVVFRQTELGLAWRPAARLEMDIAAYQLKSSGEVRTVAPGIYENYGATERTGMETSLNWAALDTLSLHAVYSVADTEVRRSGNPALRGNEVAGVPEYSGTFRAEWQITPVLEADVNWRLVGSFAVSDDNLEYADSYDIVDLGLGLRPTRLPGWKFYLRAENLRDERYAPARLRFGGEGLVSVGAPRQFRIGAQFNL